MAVIYDIKTYRIPNKLNLVGGLMGLVLGLIAYGFKGFFNSLAGIFVPVVLLFIFYCFGAVGAGDIKLLAMIGSFLSTDILYVMIFAFIFTSIFGVCVVVKNVLNIVTKKKKASDVSFRKIHLSIPIALGTMLYMIIST